jgi:hypothetical protein
MTSWLHEHEERGVAGVAGLRLARAMRACNSRERESGAAMQGPGSTSSQPVPPLFQSSPYEERGVKFHGWTFG